MSASAVMLVSLPGAGGVYPACPDHVGDPVGDRIGAPGAFDSSTSEWPNLHSLKNHLPLAPSFRLPAILPSPSELYPFVFFSLPTIRMNVPTF